MKKFDLQDALLAVSVLSVEGGVGAIYWPAALILLGLLAFGAVLLIQIGKKDKAN